MVWGTKKLRPSVCGAVGGKNWNLWPLGCLMVVQKCALPYFRTRCRGECGQLGNTEANFMELYVWLGLWIFTQELFDTKEQLCPLKYQIKLFLTLHLWITQDLEFRCLVGLCVVDRSSHRCHIRVLSFRGCQIRREGVTVHWDPLWSLMIHTARSIIIK